MFYSLFIKFNRFVNIFNSIIRGGAHQWLFSECQFLVQYFMALFVLQYQDNALHYASYHGHLPVVQALLDRGANVRAQNEVSVSSWSCGVCSVNWT